MAKNQTKAQSKRGRKPDADRDFHLWKVYFLRNVLGCSKSDVKMVMEEVFSVSLSESAFNQMYRDAKRKVADNPNWMDEVLSNAGVTAAMMMPGSEGWFALNKIGNAIISVLLKHAKDPRVKVPPGVVSALMRANKSKLPN